MDLNLYAMLNSAPDGDKWLASHCRHFISGGRAPGTEPPDNSPEPVWTLWRRENSCSLPRM